MDRFVGKDSCLHSLDFGLNVDFETGQWTSAALFRYLSLLVARGFYMALFLYEEFLLEERTGGIRVQI